MHADQSFCLNGNLIDLKIPKEEDYSALKQVLNCKMTMESLIPYFRTEVWTDEMVVKRYRNFDEQRKKGTGLAFAVFKKNTSHAIGNCGFNNLDIKNRKSDFGIILHKSTWGTGVAVEYHLLCLDHGFKNMELEEVFFTTDLQNIRMRSFFKKYHFESLGTQKDGYCHYVVTKKQWPTVSAKLKEKLSS